MTADGFSSPNPPRQMRLAMSAELPCKTKPRMHTNRRELLIQRDVYAVAGCVIEVLNVRGHGLSEGQLIL
jgi:hypothetical protein